MRYVLRKDVNKVVGHITGVVGAGAVRKTWNRVVKDRILSKWRSEIWDRTD